MASERQHHADRDHEYGRAHHADRDHEGDDDGRAHHADREHGYDDDGTRTSRRPRPGVRRWRVNGTITPTETTSTDAHITPTEITRATMTDAHITPTESTGTTMTDAHITPTETRSTTMASERREPKREALFRISPLELRLYVVAFLAAVYTISWRAIGGHAPSAAPVANLSPTILSDGRCPRSADAVANVPLTILEPIGRAAASADAIANVPLTIREPEPRALSLDRIEPTKQPQPQPQPQPRVVWLDSIEPTKRPVIALPAGWQLAAAPSAASSQIERRLLATERRFRATVRRFVATRARHPYADSSRAARADQELVMWTFRAMNTDVAVAAPELTDAPSASSRWPWNSCFARPSGASAAFYPTASSPSSTAPITRSRSPASCCRCSVRARAHSLETGGIFEPAVGAAMRANGYDRSFAPVRSIETTHQPPARTRASACSTSTRSVVESRAPLTSRSISAAFSRASRWIAPPRSRRPP